jgi:hypothetical protein
MKPTFLGPAGFERRLPALLPGVFGYCRATQTDDSACSGYEVFFGVLHKERLYALMGTGSGYEVKRVKKLIPKTIANKLLKNISDSIIV